MAGQEQGHEHGECDVARRVCEYDLDAVLVGPSVCRVPVPVQVVVCMRTPCLLGPR